MSQNFSKCDINKTINRDFYKGTTTVADRLCTNKDNFVTVLVVIIEYNISYVDDFC
jgi:hypothetical protein